MPEHGYPQQTEEDAQPDEHDLHNYALSSFDHPPTRPCLAEAEQTNNPANDKAHCQRREGPPHTVVDPNGIVSTDA